MTKTDELKRDTLLYENVLPKVSIIIPIYNTEKYLKECLDSVVNQTLKDIEIICIDDGSTDNSGVILEQYAKIDRRIKFIQKEKGEGIPRNYGIDIAQGEYIGFLDSDDFIADTYYEILYNCAKSRNSDIAATSCVVESNGRIKNSGLEDKDYITDLAAKGDIIKTTGTTWNKIYKTVFLRENNIKFLEVNHAGGDNYFTILAVILANGISVTDTAKYYYRTNVNSISKKYKNKNSFGILDLYESVIDRIKKLQLPNDEIQAWVSIVKERVAIDFFNFYRRFNTTDKHEFLRLYIKKFVNSKFIISLTSYPARIETVNQTIETLINQTFHADEIVLYLAAEEFPDKENSLPLNLLNLKSKGLKIEWCKDIKSYKKLIPALTQYPNDIIITADDDVYYPDNWLELLVLGYIKNPNCISCHRARFIKTDKNNKLLPYIKWKIITKPGISYNNFFTGIGGVLYPANSLHKDVADENLFKTLAPTGDDVWFWAMALLNNFPISVVDNNIKDFEYRNIEDTQQNSLFSINISKNDEQIDNVLSYYPDIEKKLEYIPENTPNSILENIFSIKNLKSSNHKVITFLGVKIKIKSKELYYKQQIKKLLEEQNAHSMLIKNLYTQIHKSGFKSKQ